VLLTAVTSQEPRLLVFPVEQLPELSKGKGNKLMQLPKGGEVTGVFVFKQGQKLVLVGAKSQKVYGGVALEEAYGQRAKKGIVLPRTLKNIRQIKVDDR